jgi:dTDP-4-dehydrorhamnose 3,5-epimerase
MEILDIKLIKPNIFKDDRGYFFESFNSNKFSEIIGRNIDFIQDNYSISQQHVLRGLHYQLNAPQAKLIQVIKGEIFDVAVDLRKSSPTFGKWVGHILSEENRLQMFIPEGFAHGFLTLSAKSEVLYKVNAPYNPDDEKTIIWNDPTLNINWPFEKIPILSDRDKNSPVLHINNCYK